MYSIMYSYTFYCALFICCAQVFSVEIPDPLFDKDALECLEEMKLDKSFIQKSVDEKFRVGKDDTKMQEYLECLGKAKKVVKEDDKLNEASMNDHVLNVLIPLLNKSGDKNELATKVINACIHITGDSYGKRMVNLHNCAVEELAKH
ncbi:hypothetical protein RN001_000024 [Aquatica leii]|uniref:Uncharacterized protein n=1 Tax=Aquatica leii TaxID=1421715 RepID=A0AAN7SQF2_9COLE|nr:hypothetical protein RN001_000024 [Aquatica leii]